MMPVFINILGTAMSTASVTVKNTPLVRKADYYRAEFAVINHTVLVWHGETNIAEVNQGANPGMVASDMGNVFVARTPETFMNDADGKLTLNGRWNYTWDAENRLIKVESRPDTPSSSWRRIEWTFDTLGRRIQQVTSIWTNNAWFVVENLKFVSDPMLFGRHIVELNATNNTLVHSFAWGLDLSGTMDGAGGAGGLLWVTLHTASGSASGTHFTCYDGNGKVVSLVSSTTGDVIVRYEYGPFGEPIRVSGPFADQNPLRFSTKRTDPTTDLVLYEYRAYGPSLGRWLDRDPIVEVGGINLFGFVRNAPLSFVDRNGEDVWVNPAAMETETAAAAFPSAEAGLFSRPVRPSDRDEPQRDRCGRRKPNCRCRTQSGPIGDPNCDRCGPEVSGALAGTLSGVKARFDALSEAHKKKVCSLGHLAGTWDIRFPDPPAGCGEGACTQTVMVNGKCYDQWKVNYLLFGYISKLCGFSRAKMEALIAAKKLIRKPCIDGDWEYEYTGDIKGFARIGFKWDGALPSELPGPTGGFSGCKPCDKPGADDPKYKSAFGITWP